LTNQMKAKSPAKKILTKGPELEKIVLKTMREISNIVGATLGPGGNPVLTERPESGLPASITKDGVTVFKSLGYADPAAHTIMETARDASVRTASEAGDGTTNSAVLAESIVRKIYGFCNANPKMSPQKIVRHLERMFKDTIEPTIRALSHNVDSTTDEEGYLGLACSWSGVCCSACVCRFKLTRWLPILHPADSSSFNNTAQDATASMGRED